MALFWHFIKKRAWQDCLGFAPQICCLDRLALDGFRACGACPADSQSSPQAATAFARRPLELQLGKKPSRVLLLRHLQIKKTG